MTGKGIYHWCSIHEAGEPVFRHGKWHNEWRPWGTDHTDGCVLRHATVDDAERLLEIELKNVAIAIERQQTAYNHYLRLKGDT